MKEREEEGNYSIENLINVIHSPFTERTYLYSLKLYLEFHHTKVKSYDDLLELDKDTTFDMIKEFIIYQRKTLKKSYSRILGLFSAIRLFYLVNRYQNIDWTLLARYKGTETKKTNDRIYSKEEIQRLLDLGDLRMKVVILTMLSSGIRVGALVEIKIKDMTYVEDKKLYRLIVYSDSPNSQYFTYTTPECAHYINLYFEYRQNRLNEKLDSYSPLIRKETYYDPDISIPAASIEQELRRLILRAGLRQLGKIRTRSEIMTCHGFRKYFNTVCVENDMNFVMKELLMGHKKDLGLEKSYYRPSSDKLLIEYLKVVNDLTINDEHRLRTENTQLKQKYKDQEEWLIRLEKRFNELTSKFDNSA